MSWFDSQHSAIPTPHRTSLSRPLLLESPEWHDKWRLVKNLTLPSIHVVDSTSAYTHHMHLFMSSLLFWLGCVVLPWKQIFYDHMIPHASTNIPAPWVVKGQLLCQPKTKLQITWNLKIICLKRNIIFQTSILGFHVNLPVFFLKCTCLLVPCFHKGQQLLQNKNGSEFRHVRIRKEHVEHVDNVWK